MKSIILAMNFTIMLIMVLLLSVTKVFSQPPKINSYSERKTTYVTMQNLDKTEGLEFILKT